MKIKLLSSVLIMSLLFVSCSSDDDSGEPTGGEAEATIVSSGDVEFSFDDSARFYASSTNKMYSEGEIDADAVKVIDIVGDSDQVLIAFISPSGESTSVPSGTVTKFQHTNVSMTAAEFDAMEDDTKLKTLTVVDDNESISPNDYEGKIVLFENAAGKKGAIKLKNLNRTRLLVDIKVQK
ncbi:beta-barrel fold lipoprotein [Aquimarina sp. 2-A2]|uniref:beta-barrel fold lipoprotein n=1 Tax=Aquimarina sp. 2-A2 TaxID=3382644 RepID=UPI00387F038F